MSKRAREIARKYNERVREDKTIYPVWCWRCKAVRNAMPHAVLRLRCTTCATPLEYGCIIEESYE